MNPDRIAFDINLMKPGCAIVQAAFGCNPSVADAFDPKHWLLSPTPNMRLYPIDAQRLAWLVEKVEQANG